MLKSAFAELHRRQREQAPPFAGMRERATRKPTERAAALWPTFTSYRRVAWLGAACATALLIGWITLTYRHATPAPRETAASDHVEALIASIEQHLEVNDEAPGFAYPTDLLLVENQADFPP